VEAGLVGRDQQLAAQDRFQLVDTPVSSAWQILYHFRGISPTGCCYGCGGVVQRPTFRINELKGTVSRDFLLLVFFMNQFPPSP
jgi:hypothetical protein